MPSTVYRGDLAEVTFGHETGLVLTHGAFGGLTFSIATSGDVSTITLMPSGSVASNAKSFFSTSSGELRYPAGMMVGAAMRVIGGGNYSSDDYSNGHQYRVVSNSGDTIQVTPAMKSTGASGAGDELIFESLGLPTIDVGMDYDSNAAASDETVLTDQFVGLAATVTLPETTVTIKRSHVVGVGRDVVVQEPQSLKNEGGTLETMMHSPRWLYYALGHEAIYNTAPSGYAEIDNGTNVEAIPKGSTYIGFMRNVVIGASTGTMPNVGDYITVVDTDEVLTPYSDEPTARTKWGTSGNETQFHSSIRSEIRRVTAVDSTNKFVRIYVDDPFNFDHAAGKAVNRIVVADNNATGSPNFETGATTFGNIQNRQKRAIWQGSQVPSFSLETSIRTRDVDSYGTGSYTGSQSSNAPDSANDSKQLTRVFKGCKVKDFELTADQDAEVKMTVNFDALMCYTDTGRLENSNPGDRFTAHRMFENVGNGPLERKAAGIAPNTEKPFFFYNGTITAFGQNIAQVTKFSVKGDNGLQQYYTVGAQPLAESRNTSGASLEQVPFAGSRNPSLVAEGAVEYEASMEIIVSDPLLFHEFRTTRSKTYSEPITLHLVKNGAGSEREEMFVIIDDYILEEAPLQIPDDKTPIKSELKIKPKHVKVVSYDALLHC